MSRHSSPRPAERPAERIAAAITARRTAWLVALVPLLLALVFVGVVGEGERERSTLDTLPAGLDSTEAEELRERLPQEATTSAVVVFSADGEGDLPDGALEELSRLAEEAGAVPMGPGGSVMPSEDGSAALAIVPLEAGTSSEVSDAVGGLRSAMAEGVPDGVAEAVTGPAAVRADLGEVFQGADVRLLLVTALVVAVLLVVTYRSPVLWLVPLTVVGVADRLAAITATQVLAALDIAWDESTVGILSVLVFGAGTNYALLLISRYRDELGTQESRHAAMATALRSTARAVLASATTVVVGVLTLLLSLVPTTRGLGLACAVGIVIAVVFALVVLPAALVVFGRWIFWPRTPRTGQTALVDGDSVWRRIGTLVAGMPAAFVAGTVVLLGLLAVGMTSISTGLDTEDQFLDEPEAISASKRVSQSFPAGLVDPTRVVTAAEPGPVVQAISETRGVDRVQVTSQGNGIAALDVVLAGEPGSDAVRDTIERLRDRLAVTPDTHVGGTEAQALDEAEAASRDQRVILPLILGLVLGALLLLLRAPLAAVLLVATVLGTYVASLGVSWWVFTRVLDFQALDSSVPLLSFLFLVALGVDYNIFLVTRAREEAETHGARRGMLRGLTATGGVITSAGVLLAAVFAVLGVLPLVVLAQLGTIICIGVLLDTFVVRTVLVPALALLLGDRFWWPRVYGPTPAVHGEPDQAPRHRAGAPLT